MSRKRYLVVGILLVVLLLGGLLFFRSITQAPTITTSLSTDQPAQFPSPSQFSPTTQSYTIVDRAVSPHTEKSVISGEVLREVSVSNGHIWQKFVWKGSDGRQRELYKQVADGVQVENITSANWSMNNRFLFVYMDLSGKRDLLFFKIDGKFTNAKYSLHSSGLYPGITVTHAQWDATDPVILDVTATDLQTHVTKEYQVNFDDDTGVMLPKTAGDN